MGCLLALGLLGGEAQAAAPAPSSKAAAAAAASANDAEVRSHFAKGEAHFDKQEYREALEEFRKVLALQKVRGALANAASCLKQLGQYDEALDLLEELRREFPNLSPKLEAKVAPLIAEVQGLVGTLVLSGDAPAGASLLIDDRLRGKLPLEKPLRLSAGSRAIRVEKEGFEPITATVEVKAGKENVAALVARAKKGRLSVSERHNWALPVEVDGKEVGVTPWQGLLDPGEHKVRLRGFMAVEELAACAVPEVRPGEQAALAKEGAKMESGVETAAVKLYEETRVVLGAEEQDASLRVETTPKGATVKIDSKEVGKAPWEGRLGLGTHVIEVSASGFVAAKQEVRLERRKQREVTVALEPDRTEELRAAWKAELRTARNVETGVAVAYSVAAIGLGMFAVGGGLALEKVNGLAKSCPDRQCPSTERSNQAAASTFSAVSNAGLVVAGVGAATGTLVLLLARPGKDERRAGPSVSAGVGLGGFEVRGRF